MAFGMLKTLRSEHFRNSVKYKNDTIHTHRLCLNHHNFDINIDILHEGSRRIILTFWKALKSTNKRNPTIHLSY